MKARTTGAICLGPIGNKQGGFKFMSLQSGSKFTGYWWTQLPLPPEVIKRVNHLGKDQPKDLMFFDRSGLPIEDDDASIPGVDGAEEQNPDDDDQDDQDIAEELEEITAQENVLDEIREVDGKVVELQEVHQVEDPTTRNIVVPSTTPTPQMVTPVNPTGVQRSTRTKIKTTNYAPSMKGKKYDAVALAQFEMFQNMQMEAPKVVATIMTQLSMKAGLKTWGDQPRLLYVKKCSSCTCGTHSSPDTGKP
jgi:hypothetical protein